VAHISLKPAFIKETIRLFRERSLKEILFGKKVSLPEDTQSLLQSIVDNEPDFLNEGGRKGSFVTVSPVHRGKGTVYLSSYGNNLKQSTVILADDFSVIPGPDLYLYLSTASDVRQGIGEFLDLGLIKGTKGGQSYTINLPLPELAKYKSAVIWCKQFSVLFTFAPLQ